MASQLEQTVREFKTPFLLEQYFLKRSEYSPEAVALMEKEIAARGITEAEQQPFREKELEVKSDEQTREMEFAPFDHSFSQTDILLVNAILRDAGIAFFVERPAVDSVMPVVGEADMRYTIQVAKPMADRAHELLNEHFHREDGHYHLKKADSQDRLRAFSFAEVRMSEPELAETVDAELSAEERKAITTYARRLLAEIDSFEKQERVVFYFDNVESLLGHLGNTSKASLTMLDLLTIIEVLQLYCDDAAFPATMFDSANALIDIFER